MPRAEKEQVRGYAGRRLLSVLLASALLCLAAACTNGPHQVTRAEATRSPRMVPPSAPALIFPAAAVFADTNNGKVSMLNMREGDSLLVGSLLLCTTGGTAAQIRSVGVFGGSGLAVTAFGTRPNPVLSGHNITRVDYRPLQRLGFGVTHPAVAPCAPHFEQADNSYLMASTELAVTLQLTAAAARAQGLTIHYRLGHRPDQLLVARLPICLGSTGSC